MIIYTKKIRRKSWEASFSPAMDASQEAPTEVGAIGKLIRSVSDKTPNIDPTITKVGNVYKFNA